MTIKNDTMLAIGNAGSGDLHESLAPKQKQKQKQEQEQEQKDGQQDPSVAVSSNEYKIWIIGAPSNDREPCAQLIRPSSGIPRNLPPALTGWHWGGIAVRCRAVLASHSWTCQMHNIVLTATWLGVFIGVYIILDAVLGNDARHSTVFVWAFLVVLYGGAIGATLQAYAWAWPQLENDLEQISRELAPFLRSTTGYDLTITFGEANNPCKAVKTTYFSLIPVVGNDNTVNTIISRPPRWDSDNGKQAMVSSGEVVLHMRRPWWLPNKGIRRFSPTALQGHDEVDVFSWGLIFCALEKELRKREGRSFLTSVLVLFLYDITGRFVFVDMSAWLALTLFFVIPLAAFEIMEAWGSKEIHESCQVVAGVIAAQIRERCGYDLEYIVHRGRCFGSTSVLRIFPVPRASGQTSNRDSSGLV